MFLWQKFRWKAVGILGRAVLRFWGGSCRIKALGEEEYRSLRTEKRPVILLIWHGRLFLVPYFFRKRGMTALVSPSKDGEIITQIGLGWGYRVFRGSGSHSIVRAWVEMKKELQNGGELIIVPDGPRGPSRELKSGCLKLAQETGALLVPFTFAASKKKSLRSWDKFLFIYPFSRVVAVYGKPLSLAPLSDEKGFENERLRVEKALLDLEADADRYFEKTRGVAE
jgi:lysophospholipid acyltransferase (LPLAT)-like uncharacterized protein